MYVREERLDRHWPTVVLSQGGYQVDRNGAPGITDVNYATNYPKALMKYSSNIEYYGSLYRVVAPVIDFHQLIGRERIEARIKSLADRVKKGLQEIPGVKLDAPLNEDGGSED